MMKLPLWVEKELAALPEKFTGSVRINCYEGGVTNLNVERSVKGNGTAKTT